MQQHNWLDALPLDIVRLLAQEYLRAADRFLLAQTSRRLRTHCAPAHVSLVMLYAAAIDTRSDTLLAWLHQGAPAATRRLLYHDYTLMCAAAASSHITAMRWLLEQHANVDLLQVAVAAAGAGAVNALRLLSGQKLPPLADSRCGAPRDLVLARWWRDQATRGLCDAMVMAAARHNRVQVLEWIDGASHLFVRMYRARCSPGFVWDRMWRASGDACEAAASTGALHALRWLHARGATEQKCLCKAAVTGGHLHVLRYLREQRTPACACTERVTRRAARHNHVHILAYMHEQQRLALSTSTCGDAREHGAPCEAKRPRMLGAFAEAAERAT